MRRICPLSFALALLLVGASHAQRDTTLTVPDARPGSNFGASMAVSANSMIIGMPGDDSQGLDRGAAYIFKFSEADSVWKEEAKLTASDAADGDEFGISVDIFADRAIVGSWLNNSSGDISGAAYIFKRMNSDSTWEQEAKLSPSDLSANDNFGFSVAINGHFAVIGTPNHDENVINAGTVYVFKFEAGTWQEQPRLTDPDPSNYDNFGWSVAISDSANQILVGAPLRDDRGNNAGSAFLFRLEENNWTQQAILNAGDAQPEDHFGWAVSISDQALYSLIGAPLKDDSGMNSGSAYIFAFNESDPDPIQETRLIPGVAAADDYFGWSVTISEGGEFAVVGAPAQERAGDNTGSVYRFKRRKDLWSEGQPQRTSTHIIKAGDHFGSSLGISSSRKYVGVGAPETDSGKGAVHLFRLNLPPEPGGAIPAAILTVGGQDFDLGLDAIFTDPDPYTFPGLQDTLRFAARSLDTQIADTGLRGSGLQVFLTNPSAGDSTVILITAFDAEGDSAATQFTVFANFPPEVAAAVPDTFLTPGCTDLSINLDSIFMDPDGDVMTYSVSSSDKNFALAETMSRNLLTVSLGDSIAAGRAMISLTAQDGRGGSADLTFMVSLNQPPFITKALSDTVLQINGPVYEQNLHLVFNDPDEDPLTYSAVGSETLVVSVSIENAILKIAPLAVGETVIILAADDEKGCATRATFTVKVNAPPIVQNSIPDTTLRIGCGEFSRDLNAPPVVFFDPNGDALVYSVRSSDSGIVVADTSGGVLILRAIRIGATFVTVTADDRQGGTANASFNVRVVENQPPLIANPLRDQVLTIGGGPFTRALNTSPPVFNDPDGDVLTYSVNSSNTAVAEAELSGDTLVVTLTNPGVGDRAFISVAAKDDCGSMATTVFTVRATDQSNQPPRVSNPIVDQILTVGGDPLVRNLNEPPVFEDPDGDSLTFTATGSSENIAKVAISGSLLTVSLTNPGVGDSLTVTIIADDARGGIAETAFEVFVNTCPKVNVALKDTVLALGGESFQRDLGAPPLVFVDLDGDPLVYSARSADSSVATVSITGSVLTLSPVSLGNSIITVTARDDQGCADSTTFTVQVEPEPAGCSAIVHNPLTEPAPEGEAIPIRAEIIDDAGVSAAVLRFRQGGEIPFNQTEMTISNNRYEGIIPGSSVTSRGVEYQIVVTNATGCKTVAPPENIFCVKVRVGGDGAINPRPLPGGTTTTDYRLISVPLDLLNDSPKDVLEDDLGNYDDSKWRFFELRADNLNLPPDSIYNELPAITSPMDAGKGFFLLVKEGGKTLDTGEGISFLTCQPFRIPLNPGWNFVGNPFNFAIPIAAIHLKNASEPVEFRTYNGNWNDRNTDQVTEIQPFAGYAIFNPIASSDTLFIEPDLAADANRLSNDENNQDANEPTWAIHILAETSKAKDRDTMALVASHASAAWDRMDRPEPPVVGEYVSVYFSHPEWRQLARKYCIDARREDAGGQVWNFDVETYRPEKVDLSFQGLDGVPSAFEIYLRDEAANLSLNLRNAKVYSVATPGKSKPRRLQLIVGNPDFIGDHVSEKQTAPSDYNLAQNFPNPFNPATTIRFSLPNAGKVTLKVYNLKGEEVVTLLENDQKNAGNHLVIWDGRGKNGQPVSSGIYVYRLVAGKFSTTRKMAFLK